MFDNRALPKVMQRAVVSSLQPQYWKHTLSYVRNLVSNGVSKFTIQISILTASTATFLERDWTVLFILLMGISSVSHVTRNFQCLLQG